MAQSCGEEAERSSLTKLNPKLGEKLGIRTDDELVDFLERINQDLESKSAQEIVQWATDTFGAQTVMSSSFGIQSAVMLHLVNSLKCVPVIWIDTGYLPEETYQFVYQLEKDFNLDIKTFQSKLSPAHMEAIYGKLFENPDIESHNQYGYIRKVEPMKRALSELEAAALLTGVRADQTSHRSKNMKIVNVQHGIFKVCPLLRWTKEQVTEYIRENNLPYHPLKAKGYESVGDAHSSSPVTNDMDNERSSRFHGITEECGLHVDMDAEQAFLSNKLKGNDSPTTVESESIFDENNEPKNIEIYTKRTCRFCIALKKLLNQKQWTYKETIVGEEVQIQDIWQRVGSPVKTVPQVFIDNDHYIGGYTEFCKYIGHTPEIN